MLGRISLPGLLAVALVLALVSAPEQARAAGPASCVPVHPAAVGKDQGATTGETITGSLCHWFLHANPLVSAPDSVVTSREVEMFGGRPSAVAEPWQARSSAAPTFDLPAGSAAALTVCDHVPGGWCGQLTVPLDRRQPRRASVSLFFELYPHSGAAPTSTPVFATEGGPGFSVTQGGIAGFYSQVLFAPLLDRHDLVLLDQRGVGLSGALDCPAAQHGIGDVYAQVAGCGAQLGADAALYGSDDVARDIDAVRTALGYQAIDFYGGSNAGVDMIFAIATGTGGATTFDIATVRPDGTHLRLVTHSAPDSPALLPTSRRPAATLSTARPTPTVVIWSSQTSGAGARAPCRPVPAATPTPAGHRRNRDRPASSPPWSR